MIGAIVKFLSGGLLGKIIDKIGAAFQARQQAREARAAVEAKIQLAQVEHAGRVELAGHEIQVLQTKNAGDSWKDEYVTLLVSVPILVSVVGSLVSIVEAEIGARLIRAAGEIANIMTGDFVEFPTLWMVVVTTALGTKPFRR